MNKYEAMVIVKPGLPEEEKKVTFNQIQDAITKNNGKVQEVSVWAEKRKLFFPIKKHLEGLYYLVSFSLPPQAVKEINRSFKLNENILRILVTRVEQ